MKMKFILASIIFVFYFTSCKKAYTCSCTTTIVEPVAGTFISKDDSTPYSRKMNKKTAQSACDNKRASIEQENKFCSESIHD